MNIFEIAMYVLIALMAGVTVYITYKKYKKCADPDEINKVLNDSLLEMVNLIKIAMNVLNESKEEYEDYTDYKKAIGNIVIEDFRNFLYRHELAPEYVLDAITNELIYNLIDRAISIIESNKNIEPVYSSNENTKKVVIDEIVDPTDGKDDISGGLNNFYED